MVAKPNGEIRVCIDYRDLNRITVADTYAPPLVDDLLHASGGCAYMATIDLRSSFWQIPVRRQDRDKTAFITPFGVFRFRVMPFGLRNAGATLQRLVDRIRAILSAYRILAY